MPFVVTRTTTPITPEQEAELKARFGAAIEHVPGKSEQDEPVAYVEASIFASENRIGYEALTIEVVLALRDVLGIAPNHIYVRYADIPVWSVANMVIDRRMYR